MKKIPPLLKLPLSSKRVEDFVQLVSDPTKVGILTDFDGTLAEMVSNPLDAYPVQGVVNILHQLSLHFGAVAVISGRPASFLVDRLQIGKIPSNLQVFGLYGMESAAQDGTVQTIEIAEKFRSQVIEMTNLATKYAPQGIIVESKGLSLALHWRTNPQEQPWVEDFVIELSTKYGFVAHPGRMSQELKPPLDMDKGFIAKKVVQGLQTACFIGDDLGDLPAFEALQNLYNNKGLSSYINIGVKNSETPDSMLELCDLVLDNPQAAVDLLQSFLD